MKKILMGILLAVTVLTGTAGSVSAAGICDDLSPADERWELAGCKTDKKADSFIVNLINIVLTVLGVVTVVMIIVGGIWFVTSQGDAAKVMRAKNTVLYGVIGLVISLLAFAIVHFVSQSIGSSMDSSTSGSSSRSIVA